MRIVATIQVRMGSSRLPGKVMREVAGKPLLGHLLDRLALVRNLTGVVVATSVRPENDPIERYCRERRLPCFRGSEDDVLGRMLGALREQRADVGVEIFGDCPIIDPALVETTIRYFLDHREAFDFVGNDLATTYPPGMEVEVFSVAALERADRETDDPAIREHGTFQIRRNPGLYRLKNLEAPAELHRPEMELEVDTEEDFQVISQILNHFSDRPHTSLAEIIAYMEAHPELSAINRHVHRRWKALRDGEAIQ
ncbi:MAG: glycosyltransferase family protein [Magnetococcales bacterium]|nr:glycosyltransferase family protein [Magnetococcales bacterium]